MNFPQQPTGTSRAKFVPLTSALEQQLNAVRDTIKSKQEWIEALNGMIQSQVEELKVMQEAEVELENSIAILKHIKGRPF